MERSNLNIAVVGGDARQRLVADELTERGYTVLTYAVDGEVPASPLSSAVATADLLVLPLPASRDGFRVNSRAEIRFEDMASRLPPWCKVFAGKLQPALKDFLIGRGFEVFDFYDDELFEQENTDISADGAIDHLMSLLDGDMAGKHVLVCGYGRFGASLCQKLKSLGACVTVAARRDESLDLARKKGFSALKINLAQKGFFSVPDGVCAVLNAVPYHIFNEENMGTLNGKAYLELASAPFGGDPARLEAVSSYSYLPAIPAKFAPERAGRAMLFSLLRYIDGNFPDGK